MCNLHSAFGVRSLDGLTKQIEDHMGSSARLERSLIPSLLFDFAASQLLCIEFGFGKVKMTLKIGQALIVT